MEGIFKNMEDTVIGAGAWILAAFLAWVLFKVIYEKE